MTVVELVLLAALVLVTIAWAVTVVMLVRSRTRVVYLEKEPERTRLIPAPTRAVRSMVETAIRVRDEGLSGALRSSIDELALWADVERPDLASMSASDGSITILFSDIEDSTALNHQLGDRGWVQLISKHDRQLTRVIEAHSGHVVKSQGDGFMVAFAESTEAVAAACGIQRLLAQKKPTSRLYGVKVRIGTHRGSAVRRDGDLFGRNVAIAARLAAQANGGEVVISDAVLDALPDDDVSVLETRETELKGVPGTHVMHVLDWRDVRV